MLRCISHRLLDNAVGTQVSNGGQCLVISMPHNFDGVSGTSVARHQRIQVRQPGSWHECFIAGLPVAACGFSIALPKKTYRGSHLIKCCPGMTADVLQSSRGCLWIGGDKVRCHPRLCIDQGQVLGQHIVEFPGDPHAFSK